jgi:hypothetical protein
MPCSCYQAFCRCGRARQVQLTSSSTSTSRMSSTQAYANRSCELQLQHVQYHGSICWGLAGSLLQALACMLLTCHVMGGVWLGLQMIYYYYTSSSVKRSVIYGRKVRRSSSGSNVHCITDTSCVLLQAL